MKSKKILSMLLAVAMIFSFAVIPASAEGIADVYSPVIKMVATDVTDGWATIVATAEVTPELEGVVKTSTSGPAKYTGTALTAITLYFDLVDDYFEITDRTTEAEEVVCEGTFVTPVWSTTMNKFTTEFSWNNNVSLVLAGGSEWEIATIYAPVSSEITSADQLNALPFARIDLAGVGIGVWEHVGGNKAIITDFYSDGQSAGQCSTQVGKPAVEEPVATSIVINEGARVNADATGKATLTATVLDQNGEAMDPQPAVVWSDDSEDATVTNGAFAATVKKDAYDVNVTATVEGTEISSSATVVVVPAAVKVATAVVINDDAESVDTNAAGNVTLTAAVKDQFGDAMDTPVDWTSDNGDVTVDNGVVTAAIKADAYTATITATAGDASDTIVVNVPAEVKVPSVTAIGAKKTAGQNAMYWGVKWSNIANPAWKVTLTKNDADQRQFSVNLAGATFDGTGDKAFGFYLKVSNTADKFTFKVEDTNSTISATANAAGVAVDDLN